MLADLCEAWKQHGAEAIKRVLNDSPADFVKICASLLPKQIQADVDQTVYLVADHPLSAEEWEAQTNANWPAKPSEKLN